MTLQAQLLCTTVGHVTHSMMCVYVCWQSEDGLQPAKNMLRALGVCRPTFDPPSMRCNPAPSSTLPALCPWSSVYACVACCLSNRKFHIRCPMLTSDTSSLPLSPLPLFLSLSVHDPRCSLAMNRLAHQLHRRVLDPL